MAKAKNGTDGEGPGTGHNSASLTEKGRDFITRIEHLEGQIDDEMQHFKDEMIAPLKADVKQIYDDAKSAGLTKKSVKAIVAARKKERQVGMARAALDIADQSAFDRIRNALGDYAETELGRAALNAFGIPAELTDDERAKGVTAAWIDKDGTRVSLGPVLTT